MKLHLAAAAILVCAMTPSGFALDDANNAVVESMEANIHQDNFLTNPVENALSDHDSAAKSNADRSLYYTSNTVNNNNVGGHSSRNGFRTGGSQPTQSFGNQSAGSFTRPSSNGNRGGSFRSSSNTHFEGGRGQGFTPGRGGSSQGNFFDGGNGQFSGGRGHGFPPDRRGSPQGNFGSGDQFFGGKEPGFSSGRGEFPQGNFAGNRGQFVGGRGQGSFAPGQGRPSQGSFRNGGHFTESRGQAGNVPGRGVGTPSNFGGGGQFGGGGNPGQQQGFFGPSKGDPRFNGPSQDIGFGNNIPAVGGFSGGPGPVVFPGNNFGGSVPDFRNGGGIGHFAPSPPVLVAPQQVFVDNGPVLNGDCKLRGSCGGVVFQSGGGFGGKGKGGKGKGGKGRRN